MTVEIATCLFILTLAVAVLAWDRLPADVVALGVLIAVVLTGLLPADRAFAGFGSDTVIMILGLFIMAAGLIQTGVVDIVGRWLFDLAGRSAAVFLPVMMASVAGLSAFMSNTAATAFFVPLVIGYAAKIGASSAQFLLPLAFASILTSSVTLISTSTNLIVSELLTRYQQPPMGMFELSPVGLPIALAGILYVWLAGTRLMADRAEQGVAAEIGERLYHADVLVRDDGPLAGKTIAEARLAHDDMRVVRLRRGDRTIDDPISRKDLELARGDELLIEGLRSQLLRIKDLEGLDFKADVHLADPQAEEIAIVEGVLMPRSPLIGQTLNDLDFARRYGLQVLALHRAGRAPPKVSRARLRMGDVLLLQGTPEDVKALERGNLFNIFGNIEPERLNRRLAPLAAMIFALAIAATTFRVASMPVAMIAGAFAMLASRCLSPDEAYRQVEWKAIILIGALLALGAAMEASGAGRYLAESLIGVIGARSHVALLSCVFVLTVALTQPMSNQAAALVMLPIAIELARQSDADPRPFAMMVAIAASCSYLTPLEPSCLLVYGPGKYRFSDFFIVGAPLTVLIYLIAIVLVPVVWPIAP